MRDGKCFGFFLGDSGIAVAARIPAPLVLEAFGVLGDDPGLSTGDPEVVFFPAFEAPSPEDPDKNNDTIKTHNNSAIQLSMTTRLPLSLTPIKCT